VCTNCGFAELVNFRCTRFLGLLNRMLGFRFMPAALVDQELWNPQISTSEFSAHFKETFGVFDSIYHQETRSLQLEKV
jgi:hypothetical protein